MTIPRHPIVGLQALRRSAQAFGCIADSASVLLTRSGRSAIRLALLDAGIGPGDCFLVPNYYCPTMVAPAELVGARPVFYPITASRGPDLQWLREQRFEGRTAMLAAHFFGLPIPLAEVRRLCDERDIVLIEDCAHAFFGNHAGTAVGAIGDYAIASLPKFFPVLEGGMLASRRHRVGVQRLPRTAWAFELKGAWNLFEAVAESGSALARSVTALGSRILSRRSAATGDIEPPAATGQQVSPEQVRSEALADELLRPMQLRRLERWLIEHSHRRRIEENRRRNYQLLAQLLMTRGVRVLYPELDAGAVPYVLPVYAPDPDRVYAMLRAAHVPAFRWDRYWPGAISSVDDLGRQWGHHVLQLSCHQDLGVDDLSTVADIISRGLGARSTGLSGAQAAGAHSAVQ
jgi:perosamine synthetase